MQPLIIGLLLSRSHQIAPGSHAGGIGVLFLNLLAMLAGLLAGGYFSCPRPTDLLAITWAFRMEPWRLL